MTDIADDADVTIAFQQKINLYQSRCDEPNETANGRCWFCEEYLPAGYRWCNAQCRDDWQKEQR